MSSPFASRLGTNYCPRDEELAQIKSLLIEPCLRLKSLDDEIAAMRKALDKLTEERNALNAYVAAHEALMSPIRRLPLDILEEIFVACLPTHRNCVMSAKEAPVILGRICSLWRTISLATPRLWCRLHIVEPTGPETSNPSNVSRRLLRLEVASSWLRRSGECPLSISLESNYDSRMPPLVGSSVSPTKPDLFLTALIPLAARWQKIRFVTPHATLKTLLRLTENEVPLLKQLEIVCFEPGDPHDTSDAGWSLPQSGIFHGPSLRSFYISGSATSSSGLPLRWNQLTELSLLGPAWNSGHVQSCSVILDILSRCPKLQTCTLYVDAISEGDSMDSIVECLFIHTLDLFCPSAPLHTSGYLLHHLELPDLRELRLSGHEPPHNSPTATSLVSSLAASPRLETIKINSDTFMKSSLTDFLRGLPPTVQYLQITEPIHPAWHPYVANAAIDDDILTTLATYCSTLKELVIRNCHRVSDEGLLCFIISRKPALKRIEVEFGRVRQVDIRPNLQSFAIDGLETFITYKNALPPAQFSPWQGLPDAPPQPDWNSWSAYD